MERIMKMVPVYGLAAAVSAFGAESVVIEHPARTFMPAKPGCYDVTLTFGSKTNATRNWVKAEGQRLMLGEVATKPGEFVEKSFTLAVRNRDMPNGGKVAPINEDGCKMLWDDQLHLDVFTTGGTAPKPEIVPVTEPVTKVFVAGDSTACDTAEELWMCWGGVFPSFFNKGLAVANYAQSGGTLKSFVSSGRFAKMLAEARPGDYFLISYMANDSGEKGPEAGAFNGYYHRLKDIVESVKAKGMNVVVLSEQERRWFDKDGKIRSGQHGEYPAAAKAVAKACGVPFFDLATESVRLYEAVGPEDTVHLFRHAKDGEYPWFPDARSDNSHFKELGAYAIGRIVLDGLRKAYPEIAASIRSDYGRFNPAKPDLEVYIPPTINCIDLFGSTRARVGLWGANCGKEPGFAEDPVKVIKSYQAWDKAANMIGFTVALDAKGETILAGTKGFPLKEALSAVRKTGCVPPKILVRCDPKIAEKVAAAVKALDEGGRAAVHGTSASPYVLFDKLPAAGEIAKRRAEGKKIVLLDDEATYANSEDTFLAGVDYILTDNYPDFRAYDPTRK